MQMNRRQLLLAGLTAPLRGARRPVPEPLLDRGFARVTRIAPGLYATIADSSKGPQCSSNGGVSAGRDVVLIVEGHFQPAGSALEIEVAKMASKAQVRGAVDTHFHLDHTFGNLGYAEQGIPILAHEKVTPSTGRRRAPAGLRVRIARSPLVPGAMQAPIPSLPVKPGSLHPTLTTPSHVSCWL